MKPIGIIANPASGKDIRRLVAYGSVFDNVEKTNIGFSSLGGILGVIPSEDIKGTYIRIGAGGKEVLAPIAPGVLQRIPIASCRQFNAQDAISINCDNGNMIALDGEREISIYKGKKITVRLNPAGPWVVDVDRVLSMASINEHWISNR